MSKDKHCIQCEVVLEPESYRTIENVGDVCLDEHNCTKRESVNVKAELKKVKASLLEWKDTYFQQRDIISWLWWYHPSINNDDIRAGYQENLKRLADKRSA